MKAYVHADDDCYYVFAQSDKFYALVFERYADSRRELVMIDRFESLDDARAQVDSQYRIDNA